jgi:hypothetical protein
LDEDSGPTRTHYTGGQQVNDAIEKAWDAFCDGFDLHSNEWLDKGAGEMFKAGYLASLRAQPASPREASDFQKWSVLAYRALDDAGRVLMTVEPECSTEAEKLADLEETIRDLMYQALTLNGVLSRRDMDRKFQFGKLDSDAILRAQPDHSELIAKLRVIANKGFTDYFNSGHPNSNVITKAANALEGL